MLRKNCDALYPTTYKYRANCTVYTPFQEISYSRRKDKKTAYFTINKGFEYYSNKPDLKLDN